MSSIQNVITTTFRARGNQAIATMGGISQGFGNIMGRIGETSRMSERLNNQWRAIGTTFRYAIAGTALYGLVSLNQQLREVQQQLGLISAIGETSGGTPLVGKQLDKLLGQSRQGAVDALTPLNEYNNAVINLLSTIQGIPEDQITPIVTQISQAAKLAQVGAEDATKAFTTMNVAFGRKTNLKNIKEMAQEFFILTREAPGGVAAGQQVITQLGQLAQVTRLARGTPEDMFSLLLTTLRSGIPPSQAGRGLQFLIQTVALPGQQTKSSREAMASVGIRPGSEMPLQERLARIFKHARTLGVHGNINQLKNLDEDTLADLEAQGTPGAFKQLGISGRGAEFLGQIFHRIHALRTALAIQGQIDVGKAQKDLTTMNDAAKGHVSDINKLAKAWERFRSQAKLQEGAIALNTLSLQIASAFEPIINLAARGIVRVSKYANDHPRATRDVALAGGALIAAMGVGRFLGVGGLLKRGILGRGFVAKTAAEDAITNGGLGPGMSPQNPLYVIVVGEIFGNAVTGGNSPLGGGGGRTPPIVAGKLPKWLGRAAKSPLGKGVGIAAVLTAVHEMGLDTDFGRAIGIPEKYHGKDGWGPFFKKFGFGGDDSTPVINSSEAARRFAADRTNTSAGMLDRINRIRGIIGPKGAIEDVGTPKLGKFHGRAEVFVTVDLKQENGKVVRKKIHVPVTMWEGGRAPSSQGKAGTKRAN